MDQWDRGRWLKPRAGALLGGCEVKREWDGSKYWTSLSRFVLFGARDRPDWPRRPVLQARSLPPIRISSQSPSSLPTFPPHPTTPSCLLPPACTAASLASHISLPTSHGRLPMPPLSCPPPPSPHPSLSLPPHPHPLLPKGRFRGTVTTTLRRWRGWWASKLNSFSMNQCTYLPGTSLARRFFLPGTTFLTK